MRRVAVAALAVLASIAIAAATTSQSQAAPTSSTTVSFSSRMPDGKEWMITNLNVDVPGSYCYNDSTLNCRRYGRLYTWEAARQGCQLLGDGWRLPTNDEWRGIAKRYGGDHDDSSDGGKAAYRGLVVGGGSGFQASLGGDRSADGRYEHIQAHGFYWTSAQNGLGSAWFYNFGKGGLALYRQPEGDKRMAISVRCVRE